MEDTKNEFEGIIIPSEKQHSILWLSEGKVIADLMYLTDVYRLTSRAALTEFLQRLFLMIDVPLHSFVDNYFLNGNILELSTKKGRLELNIELITVWIGIVRTFPGDFDFIGTTTEFIQENNGLFRPSTFFVPLRKNIKILSDRAIKDAGTVAQYFTDMIADEHFTPYRPKKEDQYSREPIDYSCFEISRYVVFRPGKDIDSLTLKKIRLKIGIEKLAPNNEDVNCSEEDRLNEIIRIGYGIKNGYINVRGRLYGYNKSVDPYFFFTMGPVLDVFLKSESFLDLYHYWNMCEWIDLIPEG